MVKEQPVVLFDGVCNLCNSAVQWIIKHDPNAKVKFASLQSDKGKELIKRSSVSIGEMKSMVLIEKNKIYVKSTAVLKVCKYLKGIWKLGIMLLIIPRPIRDLVYEWIAKNRYKWFGKRNDCMMPTKQLKDRFLS